MKVLTIIIAVLVILVIIRMEVTYRNRSHVSNDIFNYQTWCVNSGNVDKLFDVDFDDMEEWSDTFFRITDWGHDYILPEDKQHILDIYRNDGYFS